MNKIQAYTELLELIGSYEEEFKDDGDIQSIASTLRRLEIEQRFGIPLGYGMHDISYAVVGGYDNWTRVNLIDGKECTISCPDDGKQPDNEWLFCIYFPTGAYIFDASYPTEMFDLFFYELKGYNPKYTDSVNQCLYYTEETAKTVYDAFWSIFNKYKGMVKNELRRMRKKELEDELAKLNEDLQ